MEYLIKSGKYMFAIAFIVFGLQHFIYADFVATLVPGWIPGRVFWVYFVGVAMIAAGISIIINIRSRLAALLLGFMVLLFILLIHMPLLAKDLHNGGNWTNAMKDLAIAGGALILAGTRKDQTLI